MPVSFNSADVPYVPLKKRKVLKGFIEKLFKKENKSLVDLTYVFTSDDYLLKLNLAHLNHNFYTDILTFDLSEQKNKIVGEIYISVPRVRENAKNEQTSFQEELLRVLFHGALHLCGYGDKTKREITIMREKEDEHLRSFEETKASST